MAFQVNRLGTALGAEVVGIDLTKDISDSEIAGLRKAFLDNSIIVFRDQDLSPDQLAAFSRRFGPLDRHILEGFALPENPDVFVISNVKKDGKPVGAIRAGQYWHSDLSYSKIPVMGTMLHAKQLPKVGGDTMFASMYAAYEALSKPMQKFLESLTAIHDYSHAYDVFFSRFPERPPLSADAKAKVPPVQHPVIRTHPETKRKALFVNEGFTKAIVELNYDESKALVDFLVSFSVRHEFIYRHKWRKGDLLFWDNRCTTHNAISDYDMGEARHLIRTTIAGDKPYLQ
ncbi:MAG: TauD/TfdA dioxygenase family protein [Hyphomicrobiaceae bacterium]